MEETSTALSVISSRAPNSFRPIHSDRTQIPDYGIDRCAPERTHEIEQVRRTSLTAIAITGNLRSNSSTCVIFDQSTMST